MMTSIEQAEYNWHWSRFSYAGREDCRWTNATALLAMRYHRKRFEELEAEPFNPWTPGVDRHHVKRPHPREESRAKDKEVGEGSRLVRQEIHLAFAESSAGRPVPQRRQGGLHRVQEGRREAHARTVGGDRYDPEERRPRGLGR